MQKSWINLMNLLLCKMAIIDTMGDYDDIIHAAAEDTHAIVAERRKSRGQAEGWGEGRQVKLSPDAIK